MSRLQPEYIEINSWPFRVSRPVSDSDEKRTLLLLHGHLGNENVIWILTSPLPEDYLLLAPRAPNKIGPNQFSWHEIGPQWPTLQDYQKLTQQLLDRVEEFSNLNNFLSPKIDILGFSQGASVAYALAFLHPERVGKIAALAGFIPEIWKSENKWGSLNNKKFFIAHGIQDDIVPFQKAQKAKDWLEDQGANVTFCPSDTGHKLNSHCLKGLGEFFNSD